MLLRPSGDLVYVFIMKFICNACVKTFARADSLARHLETAPHLENTKRQSYSHQPGMSHTPSPAIRQHQAGLKNLKKNATVRRAFRRDERKREKMRERLEWRRQSGIIKGPFKWDMVSGRKLS